MLPENLVCARVPDGRRSVHTTGIVVLVFELFFCGELPRVKGGKSSGTVCLPPGPAWIRTVRCTSFFRTPSVQLPVDRDRTWKAAGLALPHNRAMFFRTSWKSPTARNVLVFIEILPFASVGSRSAFARDAGVTSEAVPQRC